jgi:hypothetical protein
MEATPLNAVIIPMLFAAIFLYALYFVIRAGVRDGVLQADMKRADAKDESSAGL